MRTSLGVCIGVVKSPGGGGSGAAPSLVGVGTVASPRAPVEAPGKGSCAVRPPAAGSGSVAFPGRARVAIGGATTGAPLGDDGVDSGARARRGLLGWSEGRRLGTFGLATRGEPCAAADGALGGGDDADSSVAAGASGRNGRRLPHPAQVAAASSLSCAQKGQKRISARPLYSPEGERLPCACYRAGAGRS
jgi:hypothetical protein